MIFLSTLSLRRATYGRYSLRRSASFLSTLSLRRATPVRPTANSEATKFLSTLSLRRATISARRGASESIDFYPRSPCGERPTANTGATKSDQISIHALLAESDSADCSCRNARPDFYPRSPCGERPPLTSRAKTVSADFYPRSPCGERPL